MKLETEICMYGIDMEKKLLENDKLCELHLIIGNKRHTHGSVIWVYTHGTKFLTKFEKSSNNGTDTHVSRLILG